MHYIRIFGCQWSKVITRPNFDLQSASGTGLAFIIFTEAINQFPGAQFWSVLFFLMLFTLGIDSQFGTLEGVVTSIVDMKLFPNLRKEILTGKWALLDPIDRHSPTIQFELNELTETRFL